MGQFLGKMMEEGNEGNSTDRKVLLLGLDNAGKSTLCYYLKLGEVVDTIPTIGFNVEKIVYNSINLIVWDVGGHEKLRGLWRHYIEETEAIIFVVDSSDTERMPEVKKAVKMLLKESKTKGIPLLILANKQDLETALSIKQLQKELKLFGGCHESWSIHPCSLEERYGIDDGLNWLIKQSQIRINFETHKKLVSQSNANGECICM